MKIITKQFKKITLPFRNFIISSKIKKLGLEPNQATINEDGSVDYIGKVVISNMDLKEIPVKFGVVDGDFICSDNLLTSLKNAPHTVNGDFYCSRNFLTSLEFGPKIVTDSYLCRQNKIKYLVSTPKLISGLFDCSDNQLINLKGCPEFIGGEFDLKNNNIESLEFFPKYVGDDIKLQYNKINNIETLKKGEIKGWLYLGEEELVDPTAPGLTVYTPEEIESKFKKDEIMALKDNLEGTLKEENQKPTRKMKV